MAVAAAQDLPPTFHPNPSPLPSSMEPRLRQLRRVPLLDFVARIADLHADQASPVRKLVAEMIGEVGSKHMAYLPNVMPCLLHLLNDDTPAVARQAIKTGTTLFAKVLRQLVIQGLFSSGGIDDSLKLSWEALLKLKSAVSHMAFQPMSNEGARLLAIKFVEKTVLLYTPDPDTPPDPPNEVTEDMGFNVAWLRGGHPLLNVGDLAMEASQNLGLLLEQLKPPKWRARLLEAQNIINQADSIEQSSNRVESLPLETTSTDNSNKRNLIDDIDNAPEDGDRSNKRIRQSHHDQEHTENVKNNVELTSADTPSSPSNSASTGNSEAVYQLVSMFAALAAQGDRAAGSLQILSSSIAADLLAEVVMVNMQHLPVSHPEVDQQQSPSAGQPSGAPSSSLLSACFPLLESLLKRINQNDREVDEAPQTIDSAVVPSAAGETAAIPAIPEPTSRNLPMEENSNSSSIPSDMETIEAKEPTADAARLSIEIQESSEASHASTELQGTQEHGGSFISSLPADNSSAGLSLAQSSETRSPSSSMVEASQTQFSYSSTLTSQHVLPKLVVTNIDLSDEAKDLLQKESFLRILDCDKQDASGGSIARLPLLAHLGVEFPLELDPWELLQKHVLSDYVNNENATYLADWQRKIILDNYHDNYKNISPTSIAKAENLRDMFPASDKSLGKLLCEIPYLPEGVLKLLEGLCSPGSNEKQDKDLQSGDRVTQGLSAVWNLIMLRPSNRDRCLEIALQVANKLFPMASISKRIEDFANEKLNSVLEVVPADESAASEMSTPEAPKDGGSENLSSSVADSQTLMSLYFALCTKKHSLLRHVFAIYGSLPQAAKQAVHRQVPILIRTIGSSPSLLGIISDPPADSRDLLMQVLQTLTDGAMPSQDLISSVKNLYSKTKDIEVLFAVLAHLPKDEVLPVFPSIVNLPLDKFQVALSRILQGSPQNGPSLDPSEILIAIHVIDPEKEGIPLKKVIDACAACFEQRTIFTQQVLAKALNQLLLGHCSSSTFPQVEQIPLPLLFMRTVMQAIGAFPALIWKYPKLWVGFLKCAILTKPQSYGVLLQLPAPQLENALNKNPVLKAPLVEHANQPNVRSTLPRSTLVVLGLAEDQQQPAPQAQSSQNQAAETSSSAADTTTEVTQESSAVS
uniref:Symplekin C-terminal domain-containing protein n=1 Tax=Oryza rufipogon TaxID=4529 RepID=A0A0E0QD47_ORYRU